MELKRVVITGMGAITPLGNDVETSWENAKNGVSGAGPITHFDASLFKTQFACEVKNYNPADHFDRKKLRQLDLYAQYALIASREAVKDAALEEDAEAGKVNRDRVGVIVAAGIGLILIMAKVLTYIKCTVPINATVVKPEKEYTYFRGVDNAHYRPVVRYVVDGKSYTVEAYFRTYRKTKYPIDSEMKIYYNPKNPKEMRFFGHPFPLPHLYFVFYASALFCPGLKIQNPTA